MLANPQTKIAIRSSFALLIALSAGSLFAQNQQPIQTPSQRYQPASTQAAPPSVHIAPRAAQRMPESRKLRRSLNDSSLQKWRNQPQGAIAQTSFQEPATQQTAVPSILAGAPETKAPTQPKATEKATDLASPSSGFSAARAASTNSMERFAAQVNQIRTAEPQVGKIAPQGLRSPQQNQFKPNATTAVQAQPKQNPQQPRVAEFAPTQPFAASQQRATPPRPQSLQQNDTAAMPAPQYTAKQAVATQEATTSKIRPRTGRIDRNVKPASRQVEVPSTRYERAAMSIAAPGIEVQTFGPQSIGINKQASFRVEVTNNSKTVAEGVLVGINVPEWVDVENTSLTTGKKEVTDGQNQARILWTIDRIPVGQKQTATILAIPRKSQGFELVVEWTLVPRAGEVKIEVTEPRLEMAMSGPSEVMFGEQAVYTVKIRNPGTGVAENVIVKLPEEFGGDSSPLDPIGPGQESTFDIELEARTAGPLTLVTSATGDGNLSTSASQNVVVRRAVLDIAIEGPALKYSGTMARYKVTVTNNGDAVGDQLETAIALPQGAKYLGGIDGAKKSDGGILWQIGSLDLNESKTFNIDCELVGSGELQFETGVRQIGGLTNVARASAACVTNVETIADLVLSVQDPKGPLPTGEETKYQITVQNRGSRSAQSVELLMQFSEGIEPSKANGLQNRIVPGQVIFAPISQIDPGQTMTFDVTAIANKRGTHVFRAFLSCEESDSREVAEGTTKFFGDEFEVESNRQTQNATAEETTGSNDFRR